MLSDFHNPENSCYVFSVLFRDPVTKERTFKIVRESSAFNDKQMNEALSPSQVASKTRGKQQSLLKKSGLLESCTISSTRQSWMADYPSVVTTIPSGRLIIQNVNQPWTQTIVSFKNFEILQLVQLPLTFEIEQNPDLQNI